MPAIVLNPTSATPEQNFQNLQTGLKYVEFTPRLSGMGTPSVSRGTYQLCGRYCLISLYFEYTTDVVWNAASSYVEFPTAPSVENITDGQFTWGQYNATSRAATSTAVTRVFRGSKFAPILLPAPSFTISGFSGPIGNYIYMNGFYLVN